MLQTLELINDLKGTQASFNGASEGDRAMMCATVVEEHDGNIEREGQKDTVEFEN